MNKFNEEIEAQVQTQAQKDLSTSSEIEAQSTGDQIEHIDSLSYSDFVNTLGTLASDPKLMAAIASGLKDGDKEDDVFQFSKPTGIKVRGCKPTQSEVVVGNSLAFPLPSTNKEMLDEMMQSKAGSPYTIIKNGTPMYIVVFYDGSTNYVIDGHHRWSQVHACNPDAELSGLVIKAKTKDPVEVLKAVQMAILSVVQKAEEEAKGNIEGAVLPSAKGATDSPDVSKQNLFTVQEEALKGWVLETTGETFAQSSLDAGKIEEASKEAVADLIWKNVEDMRQNSQPIAGATKRDLMPQTDGGEDPRLSPEATAKLQAGDWMKPLAAGEINHESNKWIKTYEQFRNKK